jgi:hypothetical protein
MATYVEVKCDACDLGPAMVGGGRVMLTSLFVDESGYCTHCQAIVDLEVPLPMRDLIELNEDSDVLWADSLPKTHAELVSLACRLRCRPTCPKCLRRARRLKLKKTETSDRFECPRCKEPALRASGQVLFAD